MIHLLDLKLVYFRTAPNMSLRELREFLKGVNAAKAHRRLAEFCREKQGVYNECVIRALADRHGEVELMTDKELMKLALKILRGPRAAVLDLPKDIRRHIKNKYDIVVRPAKNNRTDTDRLNEEQGVNKSWSRLNSKPILVKPKKYAKMGVHNMNLRVDYALQATASEV